MQLILIIDNYDSFTHNLYQLAGEVILQQGSQEEITVLRNDEVNLSMVEEMDAEKIIISPGPGNPENRSDFGICDDIIKEFKYKKILGVCLGHQGIFKAFGGEITYTKPVHGKISTVIHDGRGIFRDVPNPFKAARYHSLTCDPRSIPEVIEVTARTAEGVIMAIKHKKYPIYGLQFHPESVGTPYGRKILENFLGM